MSDSDHPSPPLHFDPEPSPTIGKSDRTRAAILNAAFEFVWSRRFRDMTVSAVMAPTGLSRSAFYQYFDDLHDVVEAMLGLAQEEILAACAPWITGVGDPVALLHEALTELVRVCHERGPLLRAVVDAATTDERFEAIWTQFTNSFDEAARTRIEADQAQGLIAPFDAGPLAIALNRLDAHALIEAFGQHPRQPPEPVRDALSRIWICSLYGSQWLEARSSPLVRT